MAGAAVIMLVRQVSPAERRGVEAEWLGVATNDEIEKLGQVEGAESDIDGCCPDYEDPSRELKLLRRGVETIACPRCGGVYRVL